MKLNIEVDLDDFYAENFQYDSDLGASPDATISKEVADIVKYEVRNAISKQVRDDVARIASEEYKNFGEKKIKDIVEFKMEEFIRVGMVKKDHGNELISVEDKLRDLFQGGRGWSDPLEAMTKIGKRFSEECRERYDMAFASNIVKGLEKQNLLKPSVFESLTSDQEG